MFDSAARSDLHLALVQLPVEFFPADTWPGSPSGAVTCLRSRADEAGTFRLDGDAIWDRVHAAAREVFDGNVEA